jgi:hypothetical protein
MDEELLAQLQALMVQPDAAAPPAPGAQPGLGLGTFIKEGLIPFGQRVSQGIRDIPFQARRAGRAFQRSTDAGREQQAKDSRRAARARADLREKRAAQRRRRVEARGLFAHGGTRRVHAGQDPEWPGRNVRSLRATGGKPHPDAATACGTGAVPGRGETQAGGRERTSSSTA